MALHAVIEPMENPTGSGARGWYGFAGSPHARARERMPFGSILSSDDRLGMSMLTAAP